MTARKRGTLKGALEDVKRIRAEDEAAEAAKKVDIPDALDRGVEDPAKTTPDPGELEAAAEETKRSKQKITLYLDPDLRDEARAIILELGMRGEEPSSLSMLVNDALAHEIERLRDEYNSGGKFPLYLSRLPGGRPRGK